MVPEFRAWDNDNNEYLKEGYCKDCRGCRWVNLATNGEVITGIDDLPDEPGRVGRFLVEFLTGLRDSKRTDEFPDGQKIFAGDIIKLCYGIPPTYDTLVIEYADDETVGDVSVSGWWMRNIRKNGCSSSLCKTYETDIEVLGNIHQHPELMGGGE